MMDRRAVVFLLVAALVLLMYTAIVRDWEGQRMDDQPSKKRVHPTTMTPHTETAVDGAMEWGEPESSSKTAAGNISQCESTKRASILQRACSQYSTARLARLTQRFGHHFLYVNDEQKYVACLPLKAGCTTWKVILVNNTLTEPLPSAFTGDSLHVNGLKRYKIYRLDSYSKKDQERILETYYKFMVVRHPLDRLLSGYTDKIQKGGFMDIRKQVMRMRQKTHHDSSYDLTAFLELIYAQDLTMNHHWYPIIGLCDPCKVNYHKIVRLETQADDLRDVVPHLGPYGRAKNVHRNHQGTGAATQFTWRRSEFDSVDKRFLKKVMGLGYDVDMKLFGYSYKDKPSGELELTCQYPNSCC